MINVIKAFGVCLFGSLDAIGGIKMDFERQIARTNEKLDNEIYINYLIDNIKECQNAINEYSDAIKEDVLYKYEAENL